MWNDAFYTENLNTWINIWIWIAPEGVIWLISFGVGWYGDGNLQSAATESRKQETSELMVNYINALTVSYSFGCRSVSHVMYVCVWSFTSSLGVVPLETV
jgi:hypothetical protein